MPVLRVSAHCLLCAFGGFFPSFLYQERDPSNFDDFEQDEEGTGLSSVVSFVTKKEKEDLGKRRTSEKDLSLKRLFRKRRRTEDQTDFRRIRTIRAPKCLLSSAPPLRTDPVNGHTARWRERGFHRPAVFSLVSALAFPLVSRARGGFVWKKSWYSNFASAEGVEPIYPQSRNKV